MSKLRRRDSRGVPAYVRRDQRWNREAREDLRAAEEAGLLDARRPGAVTR